MARAARAVESLVINKKFWQGKKILVTGHTGFKGSWLCFWLKQLGADITGYALESNTEPSLFNLLQLSKSINHHIADIRDINKLKEIVTKTKPEIILHMAAQPLVRLSYKDPVETYSTNVMGTVNILEAVRAVNTVKVFINVTTDKCYENKERLWNYKENEPLGGYDPYSSSKACSELVTGAYRNSFFNTKDINNHKTAISSARAGNVIGGGDWSEDRLIPDAIRSILNKQTLTIRNPKAIRPWQHVLESLSGYLKLAEQMWEYPQKFSTAWNFGPDENDCQTVENVLNILNEELTQKITLQHDNTTQPHEAKFLKLDTAKAKNLLHWQPNWNLKTALNKTATWYQTWLKNGDMREITLRQINEYMEKL
ncbi:MAG: CDP-glucose 4,6-dehydratase [Thiotrichales bacterium]|nr:MAG: CDP-glucose 4,6-dehydratase [Thiotrichales bacterium]